MINFTRSFDSAWERMMVILFQPFDLGKWFVIGFSAFLAGFLEGGNGVSGSSFNNLNQLNHPGDSLGTNPVSNFNLPQFHATLPSALVGFQIALILVLALVVMVVALAVAVLIYWLGARGQFLFIDNVVRNRGAIAWPWHRYARQANSVLVFYLIFMVASLVVVLPLIVVGVLTALPMVRHHRWPEGAEIPAVLLLVAVYLAIGVVLGFILFIFREWGIPLMFRNGWMAGEAFKQSMRLVRLHFWTLVLFAILYFALTLALAVLTIIACCLTFCCVGLPYLGTVILLPALVYLRCFTLDCLAQFGPEYDVWTVDVPLTAGAITPQPPPG
jgi:hypothetical protein